MTSETKIILNIGKIIIALLIMRKMANQAIIIFENSMFFLTFEFDAKDTTLLGTVTLTPLGDNRSYKKGIQEGKLDGHNISFFTRQTAWLGTEKMVYKDLFYGTVSNDEIEFIQNSDRQGGFIPQKFIAKKVEKVAD